MENTDQQFLVLVNESDEPIGVMEKMEVHRKALLHRAFSVFVFNREGEMLLQKRALTKYHSGGLWTNACCSHPYPDETLVQAARRRLIEELGFETEVKPAFSFIYKAALDNDLTEHEFDHVLIGAYHGAILPNAEEVSDYCYRNMVDLRQQLELHPSQFTAWFQLAFPMLEDYLNNNPLSNEQ